MVHPTTGIWWTLSFLRLALGIDFIVFPYQVYDTKECRDTTKDLQSLLGISRVETHSNERLLATWFWVVQASEAEKKSILKIPGVSIGKEMKCILLNLIGR